MAPEYETDDVPLPPIVPEPILRRHRVHVPSDTRFRAAARLLQSLWRQDRGLPMGVHAPEDGQSVKLGSRISEAAGHTGANFLSPAIVHLVRRELAYRENGAMIDEGRLYTNLLSSMPLAFNLLGPLRLDMALATRVMAKLFPTLGIVRVTGLWFEHAPARGSTVYTGDHSAFDAFVLFEAKGLKTGFIAIELKYAESMFEPVPAFRPRYDELLPASKLFVDAADPDLRRAPIQQLTREHALAQVMLMKVDYDVGHFALVAPKLNAQAQTAGRRYAAKLATLSTEQAGFSTVDLETVIAAIGECGEPDHAAALHRRYTDWWALDGELELAFATRRSAVPKPVPALPAPPLRIAA